MWLVVIRHQLFLETRFFARLRVFRHNTGSMGSAHLTGLRIEEAAMMTEPAVAQQLRQHGKRARRKRLVDEWLLAFEGLKRRATRKTVLSNPLVHDLRVEFADRAQPLRLAPVPCVQRLTEDVLATGGIVAEIQPVRDVVESAREGCFNRPPRGPRVTEAALDLVGQCEQSRQSALISRMSGCDCWAWTQGLRSCASR